MKFLCIFLPLQCLDCISEMDTGKTVQESRVNFWELKKSLNFFFSTSFVFSFAMFLVWVFYSMELKIISFLVSVNLHPRSQVWRFLGYLDTNKNSLNLQAFVSHLQVSPFRKVTCFYNYPCSFKVADPGFLTLVDPTGRQRLTPCVQFLSVSCSVREKMDPLL